MPRDSATDMQSLARESNAHPRFIADSNSLSRPGVTEISTRSITIVVLSRSGSGSAGRGCGQALLGQLDQSELLDLPGGRQREVLLGHEDDVAGHLEARQPRRAQV